MATLKKIIHNKTFQWAAGIGVTIFGILMTAIYHPLAPSSQVVTSSPGSINTIGQVGDNSIITQVQTPEVKELSVKTSQNPDGTYSEYHTIEVKGSTPVNLTVTVTAEGLIDANIQDATVRTLTLPDGNIMTSTGGGVFGRETKAENFYSTTIPYPGRFLITVKTKRQTNVDIKTNF